MPYILSLLLCCILPLLLHAQADRYELGRRLRLFEDAWEAQKDAALRKEPAAGMNVAVLSFFSMKFNEAGRALDQGIITLQQLPDRAVQAELLSLWMSPSTRWVDLDNIKLPTIKVDRFYPIKGAATQAGYTAEYLLLSDRRAYKTFQSIGEVAVPGLIEPGSPADSGDYVLACTWMQGAIQVKQDQFVLSCSKQRDTRLAALRATVAQWPTPYPSADEATVASNLKVLNRLAAGDALETDYPADRLLKECEAIVKAIQNKTSYYQSAPRGGQYWLAVQTKAKGTVPLRIQTAKVEPGKKAPVVLALHGAGGSENLFFDGYGHGKVAKLAQERGWFVVAPRSSFSKAGHAETIVALAQLFPEIDTEKILVVGHSMGAGEAMREACAAPGSFKAVAALGGGGSTRPAKGQEDAFQKLPFYVGIGENDFARSQAVALHTNLKKAGISVMYQKYDGIEHMLIVQEALPEVFRFFEEKLK